MKLLCNICTFTAFHVIEKPVETTLEIMYCPILNKIGQSKYCIPWFLDEETEVH